LIFPLSSLLSQEIAIGKISLVFHGESHKTGLRASNPRGTNPTSVRAWFEVGRRLGTVVVQPKLVWCPTYQPQSASNEGNKRYWAMPKSLQSLDLLSMVRVLQPTRLDRDLFPYARLTRTFQIISQDHRIFVFEASGRSECERFVTGLKLMVARLASIVIVRDETMLHEFFSPWAHSPMLDKILHEMQTEAEETTNDPGPNDGPDVVQRLLKLPSSKGIGGMGL
jgi:hypothetical protein